jgi:hypothetical protein
VRTAANFGERIGPELSAVVAVSAVVFRSCELSAEYRFPPLRFVSAVPQFPQLLLQV